MPPDMNHAIIAAIPFLILVPYSILIGGKVNHNRRIGRINVITMDGNSLHVTYLRSFYPATTVAYLSIQQSFIRRLTLVLSNSMLTHKSRGYRASSIVALKLDTCY